MTRWTYGVALSAFSLLGAACHSQPIMNESPHTSEEGKQSAIATFKAKPDSQATGTVTFTEEGNKLRALVEVSGVAPGPHGLHIHEKGDCSAPDFSSAGGHWNPTGKPHACPPEGARHPGDFGNIEVAENGIGRLEITLDQATLGAGQSSVLGKAVILHEGKDDCHSQPTGESGGRLACAVIEPR